MISELFIEMYIIYFIAILIRIFVALALSAASLFFAMRTLDSLTSGIDEWEEIKKGNTAIGLLTLSVLASVLLLVGPRIEALVLSISPELPLLTLVGLLAFTLFNFLLSLGAAVFIIFLTFSLVDRLTHELDEFAELKKGNLAVALVMAASLLLITFAVKVPFDQLFMLLESLETSFL